MRRGRECYERRAWREARDLLAACDSESPLGVADLEKLAVASFLLAEDVASDEAWTRAHQLHLQTGNRLGAVRCAFWAGLPLAQCRRPAERERLDRSDRAVAVRRGGRLT